MGMDLLPVIPETGDGVVERDVDGQYIFNYLHLVENDIISGDCYSSCQDFIETLIEFCIGEINKNKKYKVLDKYYYLLRFAQSKQEKLLSESTIV